MPASSCASRRLAALVLFILVAWTSVAVAAWRNVCPPGEVCSSIGDFANCYGMGNFCGVRSPVPFGAGVSVVLAPRYYDSRQAAGAHNFPGRNPKVLLVDASGASVPPWQVAVHSETSLLRSDGRILLVGGGSAHEPDGRFVSATAFFRFPLDLELLYPVTPPVRIGTNLYTGIGSGRLGIAFSSDEGDSWDSDLYRSSSPVTAQPGDGLFANPFGAGLWAISRSFLPGGTTQDGLYLYLPDNVVQWRRVEDGGLSLRTLRATLRHVTVDAWAVARGDKTVYGASDKGVLVSRDSGQHWSMLHATEVAVNTVAVARSGSLALLLAGTATGIIASRDQGLTWSEFARGLYDIEHHVYVVNGLLLAGSGAGWFICDDLRCDGSPSSAPAASQRGEVAVVEFYHAALDHYFISSDSAEIAAIEAGAAGPGWVRTGQQFVAWTPLGNPIAKDVCRFYGSPAPGPNSHFFSANALECENLHRLQKITPASAARWNFEGMVFQAEAIDSSSGACNPWSRPVYRVYNNGYSRGIDSNHRYVTDHAAVDALIARGWKDEGIAFCVKAP